MTEYSKSCGGFSVEPAAYVRLGSKPAPPVTSWRGSSSSNNGHEDRRPARQFRANKRYSYSTTFGGRKQPFVQIFSGLRQLVEQRLCVFEVRGVETLGEPAVDRRQEIVRLRASPLVRPEFGERNCGSQFPELCLLLLG